MKHLQILMNIICTLFRIHILYRIFYKRFIIRTTVFVYGWWWFNTIKSSYLLSYDIVKLQKPSVLLTNKIYYCNSCSFSPSAPWITVFYQVPVIESSESAPAPFRVFCFPTDFTSRNVATVKFLAQKNPIRRFYRWFEDSIGTFRRWTDGGW